MYKDLLLELQVKIATGSRWGNSPAYEPVKKQKNTYKFKCGGQKSSISKGADYSATKLRVQWIQLHPFQSRYDFCFNFRNAVIYSIHAN